jgi:hypothetical protein
MDVSEKRSAAEFVANVIARSDVPTTTEQRPNNNRTTSKRQPNTDKTTTEQQ